MEFDNLNIESTWRNFTQSRNNCEFFESVKIRNPFRENSQIIWTIRPLAEFVLSFGEFKIGSLLLVSSCSKYLEAGL